MNVLYPRHKETDHYRAPTIPKVTVCKTVSSVETLILNLFIFKVCTLCLSSRFTSKFMSLIRREFRNCISECISFTFLTSSANNGHSSLYSHIHPHPLPILCSTITRKLVQMDLFLGGDKVPLSSCLSLVLFAQAWDGEAELKFTTVEKHYLVKGN